MLKVPSLTPPLSWTALVLNTESINVSINTAWGVIILNYEHLTSLPSNKNNSLPETHFSIHANFYFEQKEFWFIMFYSGFWSEWFKPLFTCNHYTICTICINLYSPYLFNLLLIRFTAARKNSEWFKENFD